MHDTCLLTYLLTYLWCYLDVCRYGIFSPLEVRDIPRLVTRLARNRMLMVRPSPLEHCLVPTATSSTARPHHRVDPQHRVDVLSEIHRHFINNCIAERFPELLYEYLDFWRYVSMVSFNTETSFVIGDFHIICKLASSIGQKM